MKTFSSHTTKLLISIALSAFIFSTLTHSANAQTFTFGAAGDYANGSNYQATVNAAKTSAVNFQLVLGDMAYTTAEASWCNAWKNAGVSTAILAGNHDSGESSAGNINTYVANCTFNLGVPVTGTYGQEYYFDYPSGSPIARFIMIGPGLKGSYLSISGNYALGTTGYNFTSSAIDDARAKGIKWIIVGMHKNYISMMEKGNEVGNDVMKLLMDKKVDLILQGHEHGYERTKQLTCARVNQYDASCVVNSGTTFVKGAGTIIDVLGTGGQTPRSLNTSDSEAGYFSTWDTTTLGLGKFVVSPTRLTYNFVRSAGGNFTDSFTINDPGTVPSPTPSPTVTTSPTTPPTPTATVRASSTPTASTNPTPTVVSTSTPVATPQPSACAAIPTDKGVATYTVSVSTNSSFIYWTRMMALSDAANSYYLQVDNNCPIVVGDQNGMPANVWTWINYKDGNSGNVISLNLTAGSHTFRLAGKELGLKIDKFILLNTTCVPTSMGDNCFPTPVPSNSASPIATATTAPSTSPTATTTVRPSSTPTASASPKPTTSPTPTTAPGETVRLLPTDDSSVNASNASHNYNDLDFLEADASPQRRIAYMKFDLRTYSGRTITSAFLKFKIKNGSSSHFNLKEVSSTSWNENTLTYNNKPALGTTLLQFVPGDDGSTASLDITNYVKTKIGTVFSVAIDTGSSNGLQFYSKEVSSGKPVLEFK